MTFILYERMTYILLNGFPCVLPIVIMNVLQYV